MANLYSIQDIEKILSIPRWRINHQIIFHSLLNDSVLKIGNRRVFTEDDLQKISEHFKSQNKNSEDSK